MQSVILQGSGLTIADLQLEMRYCYAYNDMEWNAYMITSGVNLFQNSYALPNSQMLKHISTFMPPDHPETLPSPQQFLAPLEPGFLIRGKAISLPITQLAVYHHKRYCAARQ